jgi:protein O-GlcNAc transferase
MNDDAFGMAVQALRREALDEALAAMACLGDKPPGELWNELGTALARAGEFELAKHAYELATQSEPQTAKPHANLAKLAADRGEPREAAAHLLRALQFPGDSLRYLLRLGLAYRQAGDHSLAADAFERAHRLDGAEPTRLSAALSALDADDPERARALLAQSITPEARELRERTVCEVARARLRRHDVDGALDVLRSEAPTIDARASVDYERCLALAELTAGDAASALDRLRGAVERAPSDPSLAQDALFAELHVGRRTPSERRLDHEAWAARFARPEVRVGKSHTPRRPERLRVGFLSGDLFGVHAVGRFAQAAVFRLNPKQFEVVCFDTRGGSKADDGSTAMVDVSLLDDRALAARVAEAEIDVLVELSGHTSHNRLSALRFKPAPILATWLGYPATTGLSTVDYRITDRVADPPGSESACTEALAYVEACAWCYPFAELPRPAPRTGALRFGSACRAGKISDRILDCWAQVLARVPNATWVLKGRGVDSARLRARVDRALGERGVDPSRVELRRWLPGLVEHHGFFADVDVVGDSFPYAGTTTTCEALGSGVPVVSLVGESHVARVGASLLGAAGLSDLAVSTQEAYVHTLVALANDAPRRRELRDGLRAKLERTPLGDAESFGVRFGATLNAMWRQGPRT